MPLLLAISGWIEAVPTGGGQLHPLVPLLVPTTQRAWDSQPFPRFPSQSCQPVSQIVPQTPSVLQVARTWFVGSAGQTVQLFPQAVVSIPVTHLPPQSWVPLGQSKTQFDATQLATYPGLLHAFPQPPQLSGEVVMSTQAPLQGVVPAGQLSRQVKPPGWTGSGPQNALPVTAHEVLQSPQ
jgi:hypothetical protein